mmetsp:Transcript_21124/g.27796  ORF Transcript_21124/g.27796 Transcript_21124/m.27796 type:complete len:450 (-) Transcript_21124:168-1517(-)
MLLACVPFFLALLTLSNGLSFSYSEYYHIHMIFLFSLSTNTHHWILSMMHIYSHMSMYVHACIHQQSTAFISFTAFMIVQSIAAYIAKSEAMMGDSAAMAVDSMTYAFNLVAERMKNKADEEDANADYSGITMEQKAEFIRIQNRDRRKMRLCLELVPPLISVSTLIGVTIVVLHDAITTLILDSQREEEEQSRPSLELMFVFSTFNLGLDFLNVCCFAKAKHAMGYNTMDGEENNTVAGSAARRKEEAEKVVEKIREGATRHRTKRGGLGSNDSNVAYAKLKPASYEKQNGGELEMNPLPNSIMGVDEETVGYSNSQEKENAQAEKYQPCEVDGVLGDNNDDNGHLSTVANANAEEKQERANLNMCSAYTHVFADTCRSIAVVIASSIAKLVDGITAEEADSTAAVVVSVLILLSLIPLFQGLVQTATELKAIREEEKTEESPDVTYV